MEFGTTSIFAGSASHQESSGNGFLRSIFAADRVAARAYRFTPGGSPEQVHRSSHSRTRLFSSATPILHEYLFHHFSGGFLDNRDRSRFYISSATSCRGSHSRALRNRWNRQWLFPRAACRVLGFGVGSLAGFIETNRSSAPEMAAN